MILINLISLIQHNIPNQHNITSKPTTPNKPIFLTNLISLTKPNIPNKPNITANLIFLTSITYVSQIILMVASAELAQGVLTCNPAILVLTM